MNGESVIVKNQRRTFGPVTFTGKGYGPHATIKAEVRYDDECGNGHNTFSVTGEIRMPRPPGHRGPWDSVAACGCLHDDIGAHFPELAPLIRWHLTSSNGPMHYGANVAYLAGDRDCWGNRAGEPDRWDTVVYFKGCPVGWRTNCDGFTKWLTTAEGSDFELIRIDHGGTEKDRTTFGPKWTLGGAPDEWHRCPFDTEAEGLEFLAAMRLGWEVRKVPSHFSEGKPRELDAARRAAVWLDATDAELTAPDLAEKLAARLPALLVEFRAAVESLGFKW